MGLGPACLLRLDNEISCGDGFVDARAGEQCDPAVPSSYENECPGGLGTAACDPNTCTLIKGLAQCSVCGDGWVDVDRGEECDGENRNGKACPGGEGALQCDDTCMLDYSECEACGNGEIDEGEECDPKASGDLIAARPCGGVNLGTPDEIPPLPSPTSKPYVSGETSQCGLDCRWVRSGCGYCGDGVQDEGILLEDGVNSSPEWCDDRQFDSERLATVFGPLCDDPAVRPSVACGDDCQSFISIANGCCLRRNAACPEDDPGPSGETADDPTTTGAGETSGSGGSDGGIKGSDEQLQCCYGLANPDAEDPCYSSFEAGGIIRRLCR